ncbi:hypothetical protein SAMD00079811_72370 [Scytonema sp. HK-05]|uniref:hypothetical protein n=1 Tax=Scytonema sp. HK-05 TaxID=1137095 RepID=UPI000A697416|nr:hypothetical protein [Scytonema sp. HK-05]BAY49608.1 hypothetical protein SAMD00079811_72370 [Scytonema sp. HK-05]
MSVILRFFFDDSSYTFFLNSLPLLLVKDVIVAVRLISPPYRRMGTYAVFVNDAEHPTSCSQAAAWERVREAEPHFLRASSGRIDISNHWEQSSLQNV